MREGDRGRSRREQEQKRTGGRRLGYLIFALLLFIAIIGGVGFFPGAKKQRMDEGMRESAKTVEPLVFPDDKKTGIDESEQAGGEKTAGASWESVLASMSTEEKVLQLFMIQPEALTGVDEVFAAGTKTQEAVNQYPVGGIIYFKQNLRSPERQAI